MFQLDDPSDINRRGLLAALSVPTCAHQPIVNTALAMWQRTPAIAAALSEGGAAAGLLTKSTGALADPLLLRSLASGLVTDIATERLLTALRRGLLLDAGGRLLEDKRLMELALALLQQGWLNEHVWEETPVETAALAAFADQMEAKKDDLERSRQLLLRTLYRPLADLNLDLAAAKRLKPRAFRDLVVAEVTVRDEEARHAADIPRFGQIADPTSVRVAAQYEGNPYPRWQSLNVPVAGSLVRAIEGFAGADVRARLSAPFDVLIAGCGTGQHAIRSALGYGAQARVTAIDLSRASLAYARRMAARYVPDQISFRQGDILEVSALGQTFDVIEAVGVLHHMEDPVAGLRTLHRCLSPGGLMHLGLYSTIARTNIAVLRQDPDWPGPTANDSNARSYRARLSRCRRPESGTDILTSEDFYAVSSFRDLVLHAREHTFRAEEIGRLLAELGLAFQGVTVAPTVRAAFSQRFPAAGWPGTLDDWAAFEEENPRTFDGMFTFWCRKT
ncbi:MAG: class I SAM-dependent methyltransferase [Hyphomicrobiaceae bacterium]